MNLYKLVAIFRQAIEKAKDAGEFDNDISFYNFPRGCCGDTCYLLARYLSEYGMRSFYMEMNRGDCSHAWIAIDDGNIKEPRTITYEFPEEIQIVIEDYSAGDFPAKGIYTKYEIDDFAYATIVDITADQFPDFEVPVFVGPMGSFQYSFEFCGAHLIEGMDSARLEILYQKIKKYL